MSLNERSGALLHIAHEVPAAAAPPAAAKKKLPEINKVLQDVRVVWHDVKKDAVVHTVGGVAAMSKELTPQSKPRWSSSRYEDEPTHFLLYLNENTFVGDDGAQLADEVRAALAAGLPVIMSHENDPAKGGCVFDRFFTTTPQDLIATGLYKKLALPLFGPGVADRQGSMAFFAKMGLGFVRGSKRPWLNRVSTLDKAVSTVVKAASRKTSPSTPKSVSSRKSGLSPARRCTLTGQKAGPVGTELSHEVMPQKKIPLRGAAWCAAWRAAHASGEAHSYV